MSQISHKVSDGCVPSVPSAMTSIARSFWAGLQRGGVGYSRIPAPRRERWSSRGCRRQAIGLVVAGQRLTMGGPDWHWGLSNIGQHKLLLWLEPWGEEFEVEGRSTVTLKVSNPQ